MFYRWLLVLGNVLNLQLVCCVKCFNSVLMSGAVGCFCFCLVQWRLWVHGQVSCLMHNVIVEKDSVDLFAVLESGLNSSVMNELSGRPAEVLGVFAPVMSTHWRKTDLHWFSRNPVLGNHSLFCWLIGACMCLIDVFLIVTVHF